MKALKDNSKFFFDLQNLENLAKLMEPPQEKRHCSGLNNGSPKGVFTI